MNLLNFIDTYHFIDGVLSSSAHSFKLVIAPSKSKNPASPSFQLVFRSKGHQDHNKRLSGLFVVDSSTYRGDLLVDGKKQPFYLHLDKTNNLAHIKATTSNEAK